SAHTSQEAIRCAHPGSTHCQRQLSSDIVRRGAGGVAGERLDSGGIPRPSGNADQRGASPVADSRGPKCSSAETRRAESHLEKSLPLESRTTNDAHTMTPPLDVSMDGAWRELFPQALVLMDALHQANPLAQWRFGGGTVLMLRYRHRLSKDIDLFIDDPQLLGFVNPRLSEVAESITADYQEGAEFVKLLLPQGEIDVVVSPCLTGNAVEKVDIMGRPVLVETSTEIVAKKMYYRGNRAKARDLFDFALVLEKEPDALMLAS